MSNFQAFQLLLDVTQSNYIQRSINLRPFNKKQADNIKNINSVLLGAQPQVRKLDAQALYEQALKAFQEQPVQESKESINE